MKSHKKERDKQKVHLPAFIFASEPQEHRRKGEAIYIPNGILCLDIDNIPNDELESVKQIVADIPYVFAVGLSASGRGIFVLTCYSGTPEFETLLKALQANFSYPLDKACSDISRLRFATFDENLIVKDEVYPAILFEHVVEVEQPVSVQPLTNPLNMSVFSGGTSASTPSAAVGSPTEWHPFPIDRLPHTLRTIVKGVQETIGLKDSSTPAIAALATASGLIGALCKIQIKQGYFQPAHIFAAIIGKSGQAKSGVQDLLLSFLHGKESEGYEAWEQANEEYKKKMAEWKTVKKEDRGETPIEPAPPCRMIISDVTIEAVGQRLQENPFGLLLYNDELETFFGNMGRYNRGNDLPHWISIHSSQPLVIDRKVEGTIRIPHPSVAILGGIQPAILQERLKENPEFFHSGFMARFLTAMPPAEPIFLNNLTLSQAASSGWERFVNSILLQRESAFVNEKPTPHVFSIDKAAWDILKEYQHQHAIPAAFSDDKVSALEGKFLTNTARIALILHVVTQIEAGLLLQSCVPISGGIMESACILGEWFTEEGKRAYSELIRLAGGLADYSLTTDEQDVMKVLLRAEKALTKREIYRGSRPCQRLEEEGKLEGIMSDLVKKKKIRDKFRVGVGVKDGTIEYETYTADTVDAAAPPQNSDVFEGYGSVYTGNAPKDDSPTLPEFDEFTNSAKADENRMEGMQYPSSIAPHLYSRGAYNEHRGGGDAVNTPDNVSHATLNLADTPEMTKSEIPIVAIVASSATDPPSPGVFEVDSSVNTDITPSIDSTSSAFQQSAGTAVVDSTNFVPPGSPPVSAKNPNYVEMCRQTNRQCQWCLPYDVRPNCENLWRTEEVEF